MYQRKQRIMLLPARCLLPSCSLAHLTNSAHITHLTSFFEFAFSIFSLPSFYTPLFLDIRLSTGFKRLFSRDFSRFVRFLQLVFLFSLSLSFYSQSLSLLICLVRSNFCFNQDDSLRVWIKRGLRRFLKASRRYFLFGSIPSFSLLEKKNFFLKYYLHLSPVAKRWISEVFHRTALWRGLCVGREKGDHRIHPISSLVVLVFRGW